MPWFLAPKQAAGREQNKRRKGRGRGAFDEGGVEARVDATGNSRQFTRHHDRFGDSALGAGTRISLLLPGNRTNQVPGFGTRS